MLHPATVAAVRPFHTLLMHQCSKQTTKAVCRLDFQPAQTPNSVGTTWTDIASYAVLEARSEVILCDNLQPCALPLASWPSQTERSCEFQAITSATLCLVKHRKHVIAL